MTAETTSDIATFEQGEVTIERSGVQVSAMDGTILRGWRYRVIKAGTGRKTGDRRSDRVLVCVPSETGSSREFHQFILRLQAMGDAPRTVFALDMRGRGRSDRPALETCTPRVEADDIIAFCDSHNLHHITLLANARASLAALLIGPKRPSLLQSVIFNDGGPERDGVGIARQQAEHKAIQPPRDWEQAVAQLQKIKGKHFPGYSSEDWRTLAATIWIETDGGLVRDCDPTLADALNNVAFDERQPTLWTELRILKDRPLLLLRGEQSLLMSADIAEKMKQAVPALAHVVASKQGHAPMLHIGDLAEKILDFLRAIDAQGFDSNGSNSR